jgi:DNA-binding transcriptional LysR family regulator
VELRQLRYFAAVASRRSFTQAARDLAVAQPALSQQVRRLEGELGVELLRRTTRRVELSQAGELALARATRAIAEADALRAEIDDLRGLAHGTLSLGMLPAIGKLEPAPVLAAFRERHPGIEIRLLEAPLRDTLDELAADRIDLAFAITEPDEAGEGFTGEVLFREELALVVAPDHPLARRKTLRFEALADEPLVSFLPGSALRQRFDEELAGAGVTASAMFESNLISTIRALVASGFGVALIPRSFALLEGPPVAVLRVAPRPLRAPVSLLKRSGRELPPAAQAFRELVISSFGRPRS